MYNLPCTWLAMRARIFGGQDLSLSPKQLEKCSLAGLFLLKFYRHDLQGFGYFPPVHQDTMIPSQTFHPPPHVSTPFQTGVYVFFTMPSVASQE
jgi:hypothetical protein